MLGVSILALQGTRETVLVDSKAWEDANPKPTEDRNIRRQIIMRLKKIHARLEAAGKKTPAALTRPFIMLANQPTVQVLALFNAYCYGLMIFTIATFPMLYQPTYNQSVAIAGLHYISLAIGYLGGGFCCKWAMDKTYKRLRSRLDGPEQIGRPKLRIPVMFVGSICVPAGLLLSAWSA